MLETCHYCNTSGQMVILSPLRGGQPSAPQGAAVAVKVFEGHGNTLVDEQGLGIGWVKLLQILQLMLGLCRWNRCGRGLR